MGAGRNWAFLFIPIVSRVEREDSEGLVIFMNLSSCIFLTPVQRKFLFVCVYVHEPARKRQTQSTSNEAPLGVFGIQDIHGKNYRDTGYLRKKSLEYRIFRSSFRDMGYSQKIVTYQMFDEKRSWITK